MGDRTRPAHRRVVPGAVKAYELAGFAPGPDTALSWLSGSYARQGTSMTEVTQETSPAATPQRSPANQGLEFRHLRYLVAVADAGTLTHAAERMFIAQPTLSQQIRRLEEMMGTPLLYRRRDGVQLTAAGSVLVEESRAVLSLLEHGVTRSRQAAGLGRPRLRFALPPDLPERLAVTTSSRLRSTAAAAGVDVGWLEAPLDADFTLIR